MGQRRAGLGEPGPRTPCPLSTPWLQAAATNDMQLFQARSAEGQGGDHFQAIEKLLPWFEFPPCACAFPRGAIERGVPCPAHLQSHQAPMGGAAGSSQTRALACQALRRLPSPPYVRLATPPSLACLERAPQATQLLVTLCVQGGE
ncbi:hypothetical protein KIL84_022143 [Mauremys mutica]|uniref:Uncharacterized protein n=1 Tax=Mauremys mutica TaxID=74926 RepID=A0A9D4AYW5_9SAUR|nr:hypothetical protein KIL84_022143 [Mauremys mutica]